MKRKVFFILVLTIFTSLKCLLAQFTTADTQQIIEIYDKITKADEIGDYNTINIKVDSMVNLGISKKEWNFVIGTGLAYKAHFANEYDRMDIYYKTIKKVEQMLHQYSDSIGLLGETIHIDNKINLGHYYFRRGSYNRAQDIYDQLITKFKLDTGIANGRKSNILLHLATIHKKKGNYSLVLNYLQSCMDSFLNSNQQIEDPSFKALVYKHIADVYAQMGTIDSASFYYESSIDINSKILINAGQRHIRNRIITSYNAYAEFQTKSGNPQKAIELLKKSLLFHSKNDPQLEEIYRLIGTAYSELNKLEQALTWYQKSLIANQYSLRNHQIAKTYTAIGMIHISQQNNEQALEYLQQALLNLDDKFNDTSLCTNPSNLDQVFAKRDFLEVLYQKALILFRQSQEKEFFLKCSWETIKLAIQLLDLIKLDITTEFDKHFLVEESYKLFELAIRISLAQPHSKGLGYALEVAEKSKSSMLLAAVRSTQIRNFNIPDSLVNLGQQYKFELSSLEERKNITTDSLSLIGIDIQINQNKKKQYELLNKIRRDYPEYYFLLHSNKVDKPSEIQKRLQANHAFIEFFVGKDATYAFLLQKQGSLTMFKIPIREDSLSTMVKEILYSIYIPHIQSNDSTLIQLKSIYSKDYSDEVFAKRAFQLYQLLLQPVFASLNPAEIHLEIIPDGVLNYLPFDVLLQEQVKHEMLGYYENVSDYKYVARNFVISYCYSGTLMSLMTGKNRSAASKNQLLVFHDPDFKAQSKSLQNIFEMYNFYKPFVYILGNKSHKESLKRLGPLYKYLHFSVHGDINNEHPNLSYLKLRTSPLSRDSLLYLQNIYNFSIPSEMVFTSACNAGVGPLSKGEGLLSLARGFAYSGAKSIITSLWIVKGGPSDKLLSSFYKYISKGHSKDLSLALAKKEQLKSVTLAHPYYWAGFIPIGDMSSINMPTPTWKIILYIIAIAIAIFLCFLFLFSRKLRVIN